MEAALWYLQNDASATRCNPAGERSERYQFLADSLPANLLEIARIIYDLRGKGEIRKANNPQVFRELRHTAMVDSVQSSNAIEGIVTTVERVKALVCNQAEPFTHDEQEILGYRDALDEIYNHYEDLEITGDLIKHFHSQRGKDREDWDLSQRAIQKN